MCEIYVIHVTKKCNMNCLYCYEKDKTSEYSWEEIKFTIDSIFKNIGNNKVLIEFLGGEPMLNWEGLKLAYLYMKENYIKNIISYAITTNGTIMNQEIADFLKNQKNLSFAISLDGNKFSNQLRIINDYNSYDLVVKNIKFLQFNKIENISVHMVTHMYNIACMSDNVEHLYKLGIKNIGIGTIESTMVIDSEYKNMFIREIMKVSNFINKYKDLNIDLFNGIKPKEDIRTYIKDHTGKLIFESYGRLKEDVTTKENSNWVVEKSFSDKSDEIYNLREFAYNYHSNPLITLMNYIIKKVSIIETRLN